MKKQRKIEGTNEAWDARQLGCDEDFIEVASDIDIEALDDALELQMISIRLQKSLIEDFKMISTLHGIGYQPLIRQVLVRFADSEKKRILREAACRQAKENKETEAEDTTFKKACG